MKLSDIKEDTYFDDNEFTRVWIPRVDDGQTNWQPK